ncbi:calcineurin-like phosphoesterase family protein [Lyngbya aestuarii BL J]|uniref:Calcineurin-like phosphoesterase family protein n=1 Tax=Lyngbya aestuarii BL J TaxID=1348334 RepID=U7QSQ5_9CYAN|nr:metallophosphoesterase [Lyngbya aestuarii]ERT09436.1 calcineurin-like phosphoesterase family protein [Lyngbya aestuarii BL J]
MKRRYFILSSFVCGSVVGLSWKLGNTKTLIEGTPTAVNPTQIVSVPSTEPLLSFISVADTGTGEAEQYAVAKAMTRYHEKHPFDLALLAGDNIYPNGEIERIEAVFEKPYQRLLEQGVKFQACLGNHDIRTQNGDLQVRYPGFNMQGRYYTFRRGPVQFFALDTNKSADWSTQLAWLEEKLQRSDATWKVVFGHNPIYSSGVYGVNETLIKTLTPFFKTYGVQLYINGHDHNYERTQAIEGTTYLVCGAGAKSRPVKSSEWTEYSTREFSFAALDVYADQIIVRGINTQNQVFDQGAIFQS